MGNAFQDQFLKAGLVDSKKVKKVKKDSYTKTKQQAKGNAVAEDESKRLAKQAMEAKAAHDRELNRQKKEEAERKAAIAQIKQLIQMNALPHGEGEIAYNFSDQGIVRKIHVTESVQQQIVKGRLAIVKLENRYELVPAPVAERIAMRDASYIIVQNDTQAQTVEEDDIYAQYQIPDDLMW